MTKRRATPPRRRPAGAARPARLRAREAAAEGGFRYERRVQFAETDLAGMVHFSWYLRYIEEAEHALWRAAGLSIVPSDGAVGFPRVAVNITYHAPLRFEDVIEVWIRITDLTRRTVSYATTIVRDGARIATATHTAVCVDKRAQPLRAVDLPGDIRARLSIIRP
jgi:YbgC/YbaW family acyl-CoA thioester hydrolase